MAKHQAEMSAVSSAYEVARELQSETAAALVFAEQELEKSSLKCTQLSDIKNVRNRQATSRLEKVRQELIEMKSGMLALKREGKLYNHDLNFRAGNSLFSLLQPKRFRELHRKCPCCNMCCNSGIWMKSGTNTMVHTIHRQIVRWTIQ